MKILEQGGKDDAVVGGACGGNQVGHLAPHRQPQMIRQGKRPGDNLSLSSWQVLRLDSLGAHNYWYYHLLGLGAVNRYVPQELQNGRKCNRVFLSGNNESQ